MQGEYKDRDREDTWPHDCYFCQEVASGCLRVPETISPDGFVDVCEDHAHFVMDVLGAIDVLVAGILPPIDLS